ncbi:hypothetical protein GTN66_03405 [bacterium]|nr:hypothetical protein [bacterium]NIN92338.1 hypothetical protein [bacterium]NIO18452.1 hypothetical protein [bacterium]NIO73448.1 hypothetical protein [bacterium]
MKKLLAWIIMFLGIFLFTGFVFGGKAKWEYKVAFLMPEAKAIFYTTALQEWKELRIESEEFADFRDRFYPQGLSPGGELEALESFKEFELEKIKKKGMPSFNEQEEFLNSLEQHGWELISVGTHGETGLPIGYFRRKSKSKKEEKEIEEPVTPFDYHEREWGY